MLADNSREYIRMLFKLADAPASAFPDVQLPIELLQYWRRRVPERIEVTHRCLSPLLE